MMTRSAGAYPPKKGLRMGIPGTDTKIDVRKALRWPALCERLESEIRKKRAVDRSPAAVQFLALVKVDRKKKPVPTSPSTAEGLTPADLLNAASSTQLCRLMLGDGDSLCKEERDVRDAIRAYQNCWE